ncbi:unnamed protein product [Ceutorhynchus assimilis]|uniref:Uncharacterized protein n=1 Tax=Ceutorhynchus assimilis TaxID=467358 RepID=A0A9N9MVS5_9CUCU|nr:unnamed protein product [Ceutorhynchus assimilis]
MEFTSNAEIDSFVIGDNTIELIGYVDGIDGSKQILFIERGLIQNVNMTFFKKEENVVPIEVCCWRNTTIKILGRYEELGTIEPQSTINTCIKNCAKEIGKIIRLQEYIRVEFTLVPMGHSSYGNGAIVDDVYRLRVHIVDFKDDPTLKSGVHVECVGEIKKDKNDGIFLQLENMSKIEIIDELVLSTDNLRRGIIPPETRILDDDEKNKAKRSRIQKNLDDSGINFSRVDLDEDVTWDSE